MSQPTAQCATCHTPVPDDAVFCPHCGALQQIDHTAPRPPATGATQRLPPLNHRATPGQPAAPRCAQCQEIMEVGFLPDFDDRTGSDPQYWVRGEPNRNPHTGRIQIRSHDAFPLTAYRCPLCGMVLLYARTPAR